MPPLTRMPRAVSNLDAAQTPTAYSRKPLNPSRDPWSQICRRHRPHFLCPFRENCLHPHPEQEATS